jgi:hypothetical protein
MGRAFTGKGASVSISARNRANPLKIDTPYRDIYAQGVQDIPNG